jgi:electron transfer flavoprotein alpha subunit
MILGFIDHDRGTLNEISLQMLALARDLAYELNTPIEAILIGEGARALADGLHGHGVSKVHLVQHDGLDVYAPEAWAQSVVHLIESTQPAAVMAPATDRGHEVLAHVAARTELPMAANCTEIQPGDVYQITRLRWGGSLLEESRLSGDPKLLTVAPHVFAAEEAPAAGELSLHVVAPPLADEDLRVRVVARARPEGEGISLTDARVVVGGGRGVGSAQGFQVLEELAQLVDGAVGGSRVVTNKGWRPHADQIGQTGARIAPDLYIACGISGAIQHMVGCKGSKRILAINTDAEASLVSKADYAIIGDLHEVIPALNAEIKKVKQT